LNLLLYVVRSMRDLKNDVGLIYTDIAASNILTSDPLDDHLQLVIGDLGGVHRLGAASYRRCDVTPKYLAPEVFDSKDAEIDEVALVYGLGVLGFFILEGVFPYASLNSDKRIRDWVVQGEPLNWQCHYDSGQLEAVRKVIALCMQADYRARPQRFDDLYELLLPLYQQAKQTPSQLPQNPFATRTWQEVVSGVQFSWIAGGSFTMGASESETQWLTDNFSAQRYQARFAHELPAHPAIVDDFWMGVTSVTVGQFAQFVRESGYATEAEQAGVAYAYHNGAWGSVRGVNWRKPGFKQDDQHPVVCVSWFDAKAYCRWLSEVTGLSYALPSEAQWEYACRAGSQTAYSVGDDLVACDAHFSWSKKDSPLVSAQRFIKQTSPVGVYPANAFGLFEMHGNVWEWCEDRFDQQFYRREEALGNNPLCQRGAAFRVRRGGGWSDTAPFLRSAYRGRAYPDVAYSDMGFRVVILPTE